MTLFAISPTNGLSLFKVLERSPRISLTTVGGLFFSRSPATICGFVISVIVDAVKRQFWWAFSHVGKKIDKVAPTITKCDSTSAVIGEFGDLRIKASSFHVRPNSIGFCNSGFMGWSVAMARLRKPFALKASATGCVAARQVVANGNNFGIAVAKTDEAFVFCLGMRKSDYSQATKTLSFNGGGHV